MVNGVKTQQFGSIKVEPLGNKPVLSIMKTTQDILVSNNIPYWIAAGTALGMVREECGYIKHDTDIDFEAITAEAEHIKQVLLSKGYKLARTQMYDDRYMQQAYLYNDVIVDFYFYEPDPKYPDMFVNHNEHGVLLIPITMLDNLETVKGFPIPGPAEDYLVFRYGPNWKTPKTEKTGWINDAGEALKK